MQFSQLLESMQERGGAWAAVVDDDWLQGRSVFGGLQAAIALKAMRALVPADVPLRTLQVTFVAPVPAGGVSVQARVLRTGKSAIQVEARIGSEQDVLCLVSGVFGASRSSSVSIDPPQPPKPTGKVIAFDFVAGVTPNFTRFLPMRWLSGTPPYTGNPATTAVIEVDVRDRGPITEAHLVAIADAPPPVALSMLKKPAPGSSMTWTMEFLPLALHEMPMTGWRLDAEVLAARDGYTSQSVMVWTPTGRLAAISRQSMVVFG